MTAAVKPTHTGPEKPRHIDERITSLGVADLIDACGRPEGVDDLPALRRWIGNRLCRPAWPLPEWAAAVRGTPVAEATIAEAAPLLTGVDVTGTAMGRSQRYGFHYLQWLRAGVSAWVITDQERYLKAFERHLLEWVAERDGVTGEWPGLDVIWYSLGTWARCKQLLPTLEILTESLLSDEAWAALLGTLIGGARWAYDEHDSFRHGNWQLASASELMQIGAVLPMLTEAAAWAARGRQRMGEHLMLDIYPDGGHYERSPGYHSMCLEAVHTAAVIDQRYGSGELATDPRIAAMHTWLVELADSAGWVPHLQDSGVVWPGPFLLRGGYVLDDPALVAQARGWLSPTDFAILVAQLPAWSDADRQERWLASVSAQNLPERRTAIRLLSDSRYAIARTEDPIQLMINFGPHIEHELESHSHRAVLDFVLSGWGQPLLWEAGGPPSYDDPGYLDWFQSGRGHNTVLVDGGELSVDRFAECDLFADAPPLPDRAGGRAAIFAGRHRGYGIEQRRTFLLVRDNPGYLVLLDDALSTEPHEYEFRLQSPTPWRQHSNGLAFTSGSDDAPTQLYVCELEPTATDVSLSTGVARKPLPATQSAEYADLHTLALRRRSGRFRTVIWPLRPETSAPVITGSSELIVIERPGSIDRIQPNQWSRTGADGWEAFGWQTTSLLDDDGTMISCSRPSMITAERNGHSLTVIIDTTARCHVGIRCTLNDLRLNDIALPAGDPETGGDTEVTLPYGGRWTITGQRDG